MEKGRDKKIDIYEKTEKENPPENKLEDDELTAEEKNFVEEYIREIETLGEDLNHLKKVERIKKRPPRIETEKQKEKGYDAEVVVSMEKLLSDLRREMTAPLALLEKKMGNLIGKLALGEIEIEKGKKIDEEKIKEEEDKILHKTSAPVEAVVYSPPKEKEETKKTLGRDMDWEIPPTKPPFKEPPRNELEETARRQAIEAIVNKLTKLTPENKELFEEHFKTIGSRLCRAIEDAMNVKKKERTEK